jgi:hypothetical protein
MGSFNRCEQMFCTYHKSSAKTDVFDDPEGVDADENWIAMTSLKGLSEPYGPYPLYPQKWNTIHRVIDVNTEEGG